MSQATCFVLKRMYCLLESSLYPSCAILVSHNLKLGRKRQLPDGRSSGRPFISVGHLTQDGDCGWKWHVGENTSSLACNMHASKIQVGWQGAAKGRDSLQGALEWGYFFLGQWLKEHCSRVSLWVWYGSMSDTFLSERSSFLQPASLHWVGAKTSTHMQRYFLDKRMVSLQKPVQVWAVRSSAAQELGRLKTTWSKRRRSSSSYQFIYYCVTAEKLDIGKSPKSTSSD